MSSSSPSWSDLPDDILSQVAALLKTTIDVSNFAKVCPSWKAASYTSKRHPTKQFPWLLLSEKDMPLDCYCTEYSNPRTGCRRFIVFPKGKQLSIPLPDACNRRCVGSGAGWIVMLDMTERITMLNPLTGARLPLPPQYTLRFPTECHTQEDLPKEKFRTYISKIVLGMDNLGCIVAVAIVGVCKKLAIARPGDQKWTAIKCKWSPVTDAIVHKGRIYAVNNKGTMVICSMSGQVEKIVTPPKCRLNRLHNWYIVVSISGSLLLVSREYFMSGRWRGLTKRFLVFELLHEKAPWKQLTNLGDQALFLGFNTSTSLKASNITGWLSFPGCNANTVHFTDDCIDVYRHNKDIGGGLDTGEYSLEDGSSVKRRYVGDSHYSPPIWYVPLDYDSNIICKRFR